MSPLTRSRRGFTRLDLLASLAGASILFGIAVPPGVKSRKQVEVAQDLDNVREIMAASGRYAMDNQDMLPGPSWGLDVKSSWAFSPLNTGTAQPPLPGMIIPPRIPEGGSDSRPRMSEGSKSLAQWPFFQMGQLGSYIRQDKTLVCPTDMRDSAQSKRMEWAQRSLKLTSYAFNGCIIDSGTLPNYQNGDARKISDFRPQDILLWETTETRPFYFNDAGNLPQEGCTQRHGGRFYKRELVNQDWGGSGVVGRVGGGADLLSFRKFTAMAGTTVDGRVPGIVPIPQAAPENDLWIGPAYKK